MHGMVKNHGFVDGNKRTALIVTLLLIERSGYQLALGQTDIIDDVVASVANDEIGMDDLAEWFRRRIVRQ